MQDNKREITRLIEVATGIIILLSTLSIVFSYLFNFEFASPDHSLSNDFSYLSENLALQKSSSISWMVTACLFLVLIPFYLIVFFRDQPLIHLLNSFIITGMAVVFFRSSLAGFAIVKTVAELPADQFAQPEPQVLSYLRDMIQLTWIGLTAFGGYVFLLSINRFRKTRINIFGRILLLLSGPVVVVFTWLDPEHILYSTALAVASIGLLITGVRLTNVGMIRRLVKSEQKKRGHGS